MTLQILIQRIKQDYKSKAIAQTRYAALDKVTHFLSELMTRYDCTSAIDILKEVGKKEFKSKYSMYKTTQLNLSRTLSGAENQAVNDLYKNVNAAFPSTTFIPNQENETMHEETAIKERRTENAGSHTKTGLPPMTGTAPKILILGTMPGDISFKQGAYYRNESRNKFWEIIHSIYSDDTGASYEDLLKKHHIALWDCLEKGKRNGSTDKKFVKDSLIPNNLEEFLKNTPTIKIIILNGKGQSPKSTYSIFNRFFSNLYGKYTIRALNSSSNANASISVEEKVKEWSILRSFE